MIILFVTLLSQGTDLNAKLIIFRKVSPQALLFEYKTHFIHQLIVKLNFVYLAVLTVFNGFFFSMILKSFLVFSYQHYMYFQIKIGWKFKK